MQQNNLSLKERMNALFSKGLEAQEELYETHYFDKILEGEDHEIAYRSYQKALGGFDIKNFRTVIKDMLDNKEQDPEFFANMAEKFTSIPDYLTHRNDFNAKTKEILQLDGSPADKQAIFDTLDRNRTKAHNRVISLFNDINKYADDKGINRPYIHVGEFDRMDPNDRDKVAQILVKQEPLMTTLHHLMVEEKTQESNQERWSKMGLKELLNDPKVQTMLGVD